MTKIITPYTFIPLSKWVFTPEWGNQVSQDIPFSDGLSGRIEYTLTNDTPMCVGHSNNEDNTLVCESTPDGRDVIPGSSIKGMLRSILEIVAYGKMNQYRDIRFARRLPVDAKSEASNLQKTFLPVFIRHTKNAAGEDDWEYFEPHVNENNAPVSASVVFESSAPDGKNKYINIGIKKDTPVQKKYEILRNYYNLGDKNGILYAELLNKKADKANGQVVHWECVSVISRKETKSCKYPGMFLLMDKNVANDTKIKGKLVKKNRFTDYFFYVNSLDELENSDRWKKLDNKLINSLRASLAPVKADESGNKDDNLLDYMIKHADPKYGFPAWMVIDRNNDIESVGFTQLMRKATDPVSTFISHLNAFSGPIKSDNPNNYPGDDVYDLPELMFGTIKNGVNGGTANKSLKSRVGFSDLISEAQDIKHENHCYVLAEPKPTFYETYMGRWEGLKGHYDDTALIAGRKRYKIRDRLLNPVLPDKEKIISKVSFTPKGTSFKGSIVFKNLKEAELGAILWCLTLGNKANATDGKHFHSLGHAKPFGAGACSIKVDGIKFPSYMPQSGLTITEQVTKYIQAFKDLMNLYYPSKKTDAWSQAKLLEIFFKSLEVEAPEKEPTDKDYDKVYNHFPTGNGDKLNEFSEIKKDYDNTERQGGKHAKGKLDGDTNSVFKNEDDDVFNAKASYKDVIDKKVKKYEEEKAEKQAKLEEARRKAEEKAKNDQAQGDKKEAIISYYQNDSSDGLGLAAAKLYNICCELDKSDTNLLITPEDLKGADLPKQSINNILKDLNEVTKDKDIPEDNECLKLVIEFIKDAITDKDTANTTRALAIKNHRESYNTIKKKINKDIKNETNKFSPVLVKIKDKA